MNMQTKYNTGLVLGSGAARGLAHIGVLKYIEEKKIKIDMITGTSMGALAGACFARNGSIAELEHVALNMDWKNLVKLADPNLLLLNRGFIHGEKIKKLLQAIIGDINFSDLKIPLYVVTTDVNTGEHFVISEGSVVDAVRASISIPGIFTPVIFNKRMLIDGGVSSPLPVSIARRIGAEKIIACNVIHKPIKEKKHSKKKQPARVMNIKTKMPEQLNNLINKLINENYKTAGKIYKFLDGISGRLNGNKHKDSMLYPNIFETIIQSIYIMEYEIARTDSKKADILITPDTSGISVLEFYRGHEAIEEGYRETKKALS
ncbi:MAG: patatin-like phospholipase family protein [bacterium]